MQLSAFNVYVEKFPVVGETLVYNTFSGGSVVLDDGYLARLREAPAEGELDPELADTELGILVESRESEERAFHSWLRSIKEDASTVSSLVSTSYACNLACSYCLQEEIMNGQTMTVATADATAAFLAERVRTIRPEKVEIVFIGGEPLLHPHLVERIARGVRPAAEEVGARFGIQLITNGTLMTPDVVRRLVDAGLNYVQVTIDGDECSHGLTRMDKKGGNTFGTTWQNVLDCLDLVPIGIQGNYSDENLHGFVPLLERMRRDGVDPARIPRVKFKPVLNGLGAPENAGYESCTWSNARPDVQLALGDAVRAFGYTTHDHLDLGPCAIHQINHYSIGAEGLIYKCPGFVGKPEWATGSVTDGITARHAQHNRLANTRECGPCSFRPTCAGGCVATEWLRSGSPEGVNCERGYFDTVGVDILKRNYFLDTLEHDDALAAIAQLPGRAQLPVASPTQQAGRVREGAAPLVQIRSPRLRAAPEIRP